MAKNTFVKKYLSDQPAWAKGVIGVVIVGGLAYIGYEVYQAAKRARDQAQAGQAGNVATTELERLAQQGILPNYSDVQFLQMCDQLVQAMTGCGTDEDSVFRVFQQLRNDADLLKLVQQFGVRYYQPCSWTSPIAYAEWLVNDQAYGGDLSTWLGYDLSDSDIAAINQSLKTNRINYSF